MEGCEVWSNSWVVRLEKVGLVLPNLEMARHPENDDVGVEKKREKANNCEQRPQPPGVSARSCAESFLPHGQGSLRHVRLSLSCVAASSDPSFVVARRSQTASLTEVRSPLPALRHKASQLALA